MGAGATARRLAWSSVAVAFMLAGAGCGGDGEEPGRGAARERAPASTPEEPETSPREGRRGEESPRRREPDGGGGAPSSPEEEPGGAGDEEPARVPAAFTGRGGRVSPAVVRVPPFIAVEVSLRSADGRAYELEFPGLPPLRAPAGGRARTATLPGLRPNRSLAGRTGDGGSVRIEATAEPGP